MKQCVETMILSVPHLLSIAGKRGVFTKWIWSGIIAAPFLFQQAHAEEKFSFGAGIGAMYSGLGINIGLKTDRQLKYLSLGCLAYSHTRAGDVDERDLACGAGVGIIRTDLFAVENNKHGFGLHIGAVGAAKENDPKVIYRPGSMTSVYGVKPVYGVGVSYVYFWNGLSAPGLNLGITPAIGFDSGARGNLLLQIGYQFR